MYYLIFIVDFNDGTPRSKAIYSYESEDDALASYYRNLGSWVNKAGVDHVLADVLTKDGGTLRVESWARREE